MTGATGVLAFLLVMQAKHFLADFPFQNAFMLRKRLPGWEFAAPLALHCAVHAALTAAVLMFFRPSLWWLAGFDFLTHFLMDRFKASPRFLGRFNDPKTAAFWNCFGFDQMVHQTVYLAMAWRIFSPIS